MGDIDLRKSLSYFIVLFVLILAKTTTVQANILPENEIVTSTGYGDQQFLNYIGQSARKVALNNDLYASVMIAQALLESGWGTSKLAQAPNYNLFGVKEINKESSVSFTTKENDDLGKEFQIVVDFQKYNSYKESIEGYVKLLRLGLDNDINFYDKVWRSNTGSYRDATKFLAGKYATDKSYAEKLNYLIEKYDLTKFDEFTLMDEFELNFYGFEQAPVFVSYR